MNYKITVEYKENKVDHAYYCARGPWKWVFSESIDGKTKTDFIFTLVHGYNNLPNRELLPTKMIREIIKTEPSMYNSYCRFKGSTLSIHLKEEGVNLHCVSGKNNKYIKYSV